ncbi:hypothetical protein OUZ56_030667 [Daphnia magna]|uniref:Uncharacterized protein n=1 Tax=Daphnia magna TaxID=35525 RepID=A0ABQ9ZRY3_9CRUS|nr:hypothetical protein OUZ56_030667 [Daphnia magna]
MTIHTLPAVTDLLSVLETNSIHTAAVPMMNETNDTFVLEERMSHRIFQEPKRSMH